jgi:hypothetical protein
MMKKIILIGLLTMGSTIFAQQFFVDGLIASDFTSITPNIGVGVSLNKIDILAGVNFNITRDLWEYETDYSNNDRVINSNRFGVYAGIAPKVAITEKVSLQFPILLEGGFEITEADFNNLDGGPTGSNNKYNSTYIGFDIGSLVNYSLNRHFDVFAGFLFNAFNLTTYKVDHWKSPSINETYFAEQKKIYFFESGLVELGVKYKF